jgi:Protein of unknown function (DUF2961)
MRRYLLLLLLVLVSFTAHAQQPQTQTAPAFDVNATYVNGFAAGGYAPSPGSGLTLNISAGTSTCPGEVDYAGGTLTMTASTTNYVYLNTSSSCVPAVSTSSSVFTANFPIATVVTSGAITAVHDVRSIFSLSPAGGGGGGGIGGAVATCSNQYSFAEYLLSGNAVGCGPVPPSVNGSYLCGYAVTGSAAVAPTCPLLGLGNRGVSGSTSTDTVLYSDNAGLVNYQGTVAVATALPTPATLGNTNFFTVLTNVSTGPGGVVTVTPASYTINGNATLVIVQGQECRIGINPTVGTDWLAACGQFSSGSTVSSDFPMYNAAGKLVDSGVSSVAGGGATADIFSSGKSGGTLGSESHKNLSITNGSTSTILSTVSGAGYVSEIFIASNQYASEVIVTVDGEGTPSIDANVADLLGESYLDTQPAFNGQWISGSNNGSGNPGGSLRIPIPFASSVLVQVKNNSGSTAVITSHITYHTGISDTWAYTQRLKLAVLSASGVTANTETNMVNVSPGKKGRLAAICWLYDGFPGSVSGTNRTPPLEGAMKIYIDGAGSAQYQTSGTEDFFGTGWYFRNFSTFGTGPTTTIAPGTTSNVLTILNSNTYGAQRFFINDPITFTSALKASWTCGNTSAVSFTGTCTIKTSVYYYQEN